MESVVLLGDSVFDNKAYTAGAPDVAAHLRRFLGDARVTLCAIDGATTVDLGPQLDRVPKHATRVLLSLGGNDALENADLLSAWGEPVEYRVLADGQAFEVVALDGEGFSNDALRVQGGRSVGQAATSEAAAEPEGDGAAEAAPGE